MKTFKFQFIVAILVAFGFTGCTNDPVTTDKAELVIPSINNSAIALNTFFQESGDYINSPESPFLIGVDDVMDNLGQYLLIDIRFHEDYIKGHIDGAINVDRENIMAFLQNLNIYQYSKIVLIDNTGQGSAYVASILRAIGYGNVFPMKYGMSVWNEAFTFNWTDKVGNKYAEYVTKAPTEKNPKGDYPEIKTAGNTISEVLAERAKAEINSNFAVTIDNLIPTIDDYYIVNYWPKSKYEEAHMVGARWYEPKKSMRADEDLATLPTDKKILVYCATGQNSASLVGYLRLLGYDAFSLRFGSNSFMNKNAIANDWNGFVAKDRLHHYPIIAGDKPSVEKEAKANAIINPDMNFKRRTVVLPNPDEVCD